MSALAVAQTVAHATGNPILLGIEKIKRVFDQTLQAMDAMDDFRSKAIGVMGQSNALMLEQPARADNCVDCTRQAQAKEAAQAAALSRDTGGPVKLLDAVASEAGCGAVGLGLQAVAEHDPVKIGS